MVNKLTLKITIKGTGHKNITSTHKTTFQITKDSYLTETGHCIVGINANKSLMDFTGEQKEKIRNSKKIIIKLIVDNLEETIIGEGNKNLQLNHNSDIVIRKSNFICNRTIMVKANKSANDINREIINKLKNGANYILEIIC